MIITYCPPPVIRPARPAGTRRRRGRAVPATVLAALAILVLTLIMFG